MNLIFLYTSLEQKYQKNIIQKPLQHSLNKLISCIYLSSYPNSDFRDKLLDLINIYLRTVV